MPHREINTNALTQKKSKSNKKGIDCKKIYIYVVIFFVNRSWYLALYCTTLFFGVWNYTVGYIRMKASKMNLCFPNYYHKPEIVQGSRYSRSILYQCTNAESYKKKLINIYYDAFAVY